MRGALRAVAMFLSYSVSGYGEPLPQDVEDVLARVEAATERHGAIEGTLRWAFTAPLLGPQGKAYRKERKFSVVSDAQGRFILTDTEWGISRVCDAATVLVDDAAQGKASLFDISQARGDTSLAVKAMGEMRSITPYLRPLELDAYRGAGRLTEQFEFQSLGTEGDALVLLGRGRTGSKQPDIAITVDPGLDYNIVKITYYRGLVRCYYEDFRKTADGHWLPWKWRQEIVSRRNGVLSAEEIVLASVTTNARVDSSTFTVSAPEGARVTDYRKRHTYAAWWLREHVRDLLEGILDECDFILSDVLSIQSIQTSGRTSAYFAPSAVLLVAILLFLLVRRRRQHGRSQRTDTGDMDAPNERR